VEEDLLQNKLLYCNDVFIFYNVSQGSTYKLKGKLLFLRSLINIIKLNENKFVFFYIFIVRWNC
jgi:hypothetical protein